MTDWSRYGTCEECGLRTGEPCENGRSGRQLKNPHRGRPKLPAEPASVPDDDQGVSPMLDNAELQPSNPTGKRRSDAEVPPEVPRDQWDRPRIVRAVQDGGGGWMVPRAQDGRRILELEGFTRASTLGGALEDQHGLNVWRGGMIVFGMSRRPDLVLLAQAIPGTEDKIQERRPLYQIAEKAQEAAEASSAANVGTAIHKLTEQADIGPLAVHLGKYQGTVDAYLEQMAGWRIVQSETFVVSDYFHAAGSFDRLITPEHPMALVDADGHIVNVIMPGDLVVVDIKTSTTADYFGTKFFAQLAVYVTGQAYQRDREKPNFGDRTPLGQRTDIALILHIPQGQAVAQWHWMDMRTGMALAQLACVVLESRKKRFLRKYMRPVQAVVAPDDVIAAADQERAENGHLLTTIIGGPYNLPNRDPLRSRHLGPVAAQIAAVPELTEAEAEAIDAELVADGRHPEGRFTAPAATLGRNLANGHADAMAEALEECPDCGHVHQEHSPCPTFVKEADLPGPEETAPLPHGWESSREQAQSHAPEETDPDDRNTVSNGAQAGSGLGPSLQEAAARTAVEDKLIRAIERARSVPELMDLHNRATAAGYWSDRVKTAATARKLQLRERAALTEGILTQ